MGLCSPWLDADKIVGCSADDFDEGILDAALLLASGVLFAKTGRQWPGLCSDVVRPALGYQSAAPFGAIPLDPWWSSFWGTRACLCNEGVVLPGYPVRSITTVKVDGETLDPSDYQLQDRRELLRVGGSWPTTQRLDLADTEVGTFSIAYGWGTAPPAESLLPLSKLTCEYAKAAAGQPCGLAEEITQQIRQGVTLIGLSPDQFGNRPTGIRLVDAWVQSVNPNHLARRPRILSPDAARSHRS